VDSPAPVTGPTDPPMLPAAPPPPVAPAPAAEPTAPPAFQPEPLVPMDNAPPPVPSPSDQLREQFPIAAEPPAPAAEPPALQPTPLEEMVLPEAPEVASDPILLGCPRTWYVQASALYFVRNEPFDHELGTRITVGYVRDCLDGFEASYVGEPGGPFVWTFHKTVIPDDGIPVNHDYRYTMQNFELSKKWWGWNVISTSLGLRYVRIGEHYTLDRFETALFGEEGFLTVETRNDLLGPQFGVDLYYPLGRWNSTLRAKAGIYANVADGNVKLDHAGVREVDNGEDEVQFAFLGELGWFGSYRILPRVTAFVGYELWYVYGVAEAVKQKVQPFTLETGKEVETDGDIFYHGGTVGLEVTW
jgi:hypothetical protein